MYLHSRQNIAKIHVNTTIIFEDSYIRPRTFVKNLGLHIDRFMTFENHVDNIHRKVMGTLIYLSHIKNRIPVETRISVIQTLVLSIINIVQIYGVQQTKVKFRKFKNCKTLLPG